ncbi:MAG: hypothetical protein HS126_18865 [Anaerolineales bacterium]|nr:hypothetical protein [Anaerolineales bacterium]
MNKKLIELLDEFEQYLNHQKAGSYHYWALLQNHSYPIEAMAERRRYDQLEEIYAKFTILRHQMEETKAEPSLAR